MDERDKPFLNIFNDVNYQESENGSFKDKYFAISERIGGKKLSYSTMMLEPGYKACPFHNHHINEEMFYVISGIGTLRFGENSHFIEAGDIIACPPGGQELAHQIINTGQRELHVLCVSTNESADICEYPDSQKVLSTAGEQGQRRFRHIARLKDAVDYFDGED